MSRFPGQKTVFRVCAAFIAANAIWRLWEWLGRNVSGFGLDLSRMILFAVGMFVIDVTVFPVLGMPVRESISLYWAGFTFFWVPLFAVQLAVFIFHITSTPAIVVLYILAFIGGTLLHMAWNLRAFRPHEIKIAGKIPERNEGEDDGKEG